MDSFFWRRQEREGVAWARTRAWLVSLAIAALVTGLAAALRCALTPLFGTRMPFLTFFPAIMVCAAQGGVRSGILGTLLSAGIAMYFWLPPVGMGIDDAGDALGLAIFTGSGFAIAALHEALHRRQAEVVAARVEAEEAAREAAAANRAKDEFLSILSHELRTPLSAILGWANVLRTRTCDAGVQARALASIERNATAQAQIVEDILDVSRIVTGKLRLELRPTDLAPLVSAALEVVRPAAEAKELTLVATVDPDGGIVSGDAGRLQQIVWNLLANAVKFTRRGGRIEVRLQREASELRLTVTDDGEGIPAEFLPHVFERFRQADATSTRAHGGLGLGLALVRHLVELHGGTVVAASGGPEKGAMFTVRLPVHAAAQMPEGARNPEPLPASASLAGLRVLVVDDDPDTLEMLAAILEDHGASVAVAASAADGLRALERQPVDVLVSDIDMPGENGYDLMRRAAALLEARGQHVPALALTACAGARDVQEAARAGFQAHVSKPFVPAQLIQMVAQLGFHRGEPAAT